MGGLGYLSSIYNRIRLGSNPRWRIQMRWPCRLVWSGLNPFKVATGIQIPPRSLWV